MEPRGRKRRKEGEKEDMKSDNSERWGEMAQELEKKRRLKGKTEWLPFMLSLE